MNRYRACLLMGIPPWAVIGGAVFGGFADVAGFAIQLIGSIGIFIHAYRLFKERR